MATLKPFGSKVKNPGALAAAIGRKKKRPKKLAPPAPKLRPNAPNLPTAPVAAKPALGGVGGFEPAVKTPGLGGRY